MSMIWPMRIGMSDGVAAKLADHALKWTLEELADSETQRLAFTEAKRASPDLAGLLADTTSALRRDGVVIVEGFPPQSQGLVVFASALGEVNATYNGPAPGRLVHDLVAKTAHHRREDPMHNDSVFIERPHAYIGMVCVEPSGTQDGKTMLLRATTVYQRLRELGADIDLLRDPVFPFAEPTSQDPGAEPPQVFLRPLLTVAGDDVQVLWRPTRVRAGIELRPDTLDAPHLAALELFERTIHDPELATLTLLRRGDLILVDNRRVLHGRTAIEAGGEDRHLKRVKVHA